MFMHSNEQRKQALELENELTFKRTFIHNYVIFGKNARVMANGNSAFSNSYKDWMITGAISGATIAINGVISILGVLGFLAAPVTGGLSIAISMIGLCSAIGYNLYRYKKNVSEARCADAIIGDADLHEQGEMIANKLIPIYKHTFATSTKAETIGLAKSSCNIFTAAMEKNAITKIDSSLRISTIKSVFMRWIHLASTCDIKDIIRNAFNNKRTSMDTENDTSTLSELPRMIN